MSKGTVYACNLCGSPLVNREDGPSEFDRDPRVFQGFAVNAGRTISLEGGNIHLCIPCTQSIYSAIVTNTRLQVLIHEKTGPLGGVVDAAVQARHLIPERPAGPLHPEVEHHQD